MSKGFYRKNNSPKIGAIPHCMVVLSSATHTEWAAGVIGGFGKERWKEIPKRHEGTVLKAGEGQGILGR